MNAEVARQLTIELAFIDQSLRRRREVLAAEVTRARGVQAKWGYVAYCQGSVEGLDAARRVLNIRLEQIDQQRRVTKDNGS